MPLNKDSYFCLSENMEFKMVGNMYKTPAGDLRVIVHRPGLTLLWRVLLVIVCLAIWCVGYYVGGLDNGAVPTQLLYEEREHLLAKIVEYRKRIGDLEIKIAQKEVEIEIVQTSSEKVRDDYTDLFNQLDELNAKVSNYQRVLKPNAGAQGIVMGLLEIKHGADDGEYTFSLDFFQAIDRRKIAGEVTMQLKGELNGEEKTWDFTSLNTKEPLQLKLGVVHYQTQSGVIVLPKGAKPKEVIVNAEITQGKTVSLSKTFGWSLRELSNDVEQGEA